MASYEERLSKEAYAEARRRIKAWRQGEELDLSIWDLERIPSEIAKLTKLERLKVTGDQVGEKLPLWDLSPLSGLRELVVLDCSKTQVSNLGPLAGLSNLLTLEFSGPQISDLGPLSGLTNLESLSCSHTQVSDLGPLAGLKNLQELYCSGRQISDLRPLEGLSSLQSLNCRNTPVSDLGPLAGLSALQDLTAQDLHLTESPNVEFWFSRSLKEVDLRWSTWPAVPTGLLVDSNCLSTMRSHLRDLGEASERMEEARLLLLGNGRIGKTQIRRRLAGEDFDEDVPSTHGISVTPLCVPDRPTRKFHAWDFGGQDLYHGVHALFIRGRAVVMAVWGVETEESATHEDEGQVFRNHPLPYWLNQIEALAGPEVPLLVVQTRCDDEGQEQDLPLATLEAAQAFRHRNYLHYSALNDRGRLQLNDALTKAYDALEKPMIGRSRAEVKRKIEAFIAEDSAYPPQKRHHRIMKMEDFKKLYVEAGGVSDEKIFLKLLDYTGVIIWSEKIFAETILLDQSWALEAIYALFERRRVFGALKAAQGRFTRAFLGEQLWDEQEHPIED